MSVIDPVEEAFKDGKKLQAFLEEQDALQIEISRRQELIIDARIKGEPEPEFPYLEGQDDPWLFV